MFLVNVNAEIVACILSFRKSRHKPNLKSNSKYGFSPDLGGKNGGVLSMRLQVILDSSFARPGSAPIWGGKKGEFRDWTRAPAAGICEYNNPVIKGFEMLPAGQEGFGPSEMCTSARNLVYNPSIPTAIFESENYLLLKYTKMNRVRRHS